ncbi:MAG TPA: 50S ribosomal protein L3 N(5)-glutamine methyltransferase [Opitutaceae bacterium]|nr:50S ribosomal protein L3 N(5)-glutamine methyltransferase [Opitutaceae bacterium]
MPRPAKRHAALFAGTAGFVTIGDWLRFAVSLLNREHVVLAQGTPHAGDEALALVKHALRLDEDLQPFLQSRLTPAEVRAVKAVLTRRVAERVPAAYITGEAWLGGLRFHVNEHTLIPRSYFVELIPDALQIALGKRKVRRALDLCTGSGCLAILLANAFPEAIVDGTDVSGAALDVAQQNIDDHGLADRVHLLEGDLFAPISARNYDLIISNPPYEPSPLLDALPPEFRHEPRMALDGGGDGMTLVRRIITEARAPLAPGGVLAIEVGALRPEIEVEFAKIAFDWPVLVDGSQAVCVTSAGALRAAR